MAITNNSFSEFLEFRLQEVVSRNIRNYIKQSGLTAQALSCSTNLSIATINRLKTGEHLSIHSICLMAEALNKDPLLFFMDQEEAKYDSY